MQQNNAYNCSLQNFREEDLRGHSHRFFGRFESVNKPTEFVVLSSDLGKVVTLFDKTSHHEAIWVTGDLAPFNLTLTLHAECLR
jgi:hypothetical protein